MRKHKVKEAYKVTQARICGWTPESGEEYKLYEIVKEGSLRDYLSMVKTYINGFFIEIASRRNLRRINKELSRKV